ncbi:hypothetical protein BD560DRAFT_423426 [Blakeslea trispora]|nr:hypothetical protein BD560DRAFT_423426 [Blakeslea trispora]
MKQIERLVIDGFQDIISRIGQETDEKVSQVSSAITKALEKFGKSITERLNSKLNETEKAIESVKKNKMNMSEKEVIHKEIESFRTSVIESQRKTFNTIYTEMTTQFRQATEQSEKSLKQLNYDTITASVQSKVMAQLDSKLKENLDQLKKENAQLIQQHQENDSKLSAKITEAVSKQVKQQINQDNLKNTLTQLPEYQSLLSMRDTLRQNPVALQKTEGTSSADLKAVLASVNRLSEELTELRQRTNSTRTIVDALKDTSPETPKDVDFKAAVKHIQEMEREVSTIYSNIKMMETAVDAKSKLIEETADQLQQPPQAGSGSRKRPRLDGEGENASEDVTVLLNRLSELENKHQKLLDFILQCKDTVLDDMFPTRLQAAMKKIEQVLVNHETFIAYLIDPFATSKKVEKTSIDFAQETSMLTPAMLDAITQLVKKTAQDVSAPLQKRIKQLEEKLDSQTANQ